MLRSPGARRPSSERKSPWIGAAAGGNQLEHAVEIFLTDVKRDVNGPAMPFRPIGKRVDLLDAPKVDDWEIRRNALPGLTDEFQSEGFGVKLFRLAKSLVSTRHGSN